MIHITVFCYIFTILIGVSALTVQWLAGKGDTEKNFSVMKPFIVMLLIMNVYDFIIYYSDNIILESTIVYPRGNILFSLGDSLMAILVILWLRVEKDICKSRRFDQCVKIGQWYLIIYVVIWILAIAFFRQQYWVRLIIDIPLIGLLLAGSGAYIYDDIKNKCHHALIIYKSVITVFILINYGTYFINESGILDAKGNMLMDITIFFWLVINAANITLLYKRDFHESYLSPPESTPAVVDLQDALEAVRTKFELTKREIEILEQIYAGKNNTQIAETLFISESTVKAHIYNIFRKLHVKSRVEAVCVVREEKEIQIKS